MALATAHTSRMYVSARRAPVAGQEVGLGDRKNVHFTRDKNLRLAIFVPAKARATGQAQQGTHIATALSRTAYHQLRAFKPTSTDATSLAMESALQASESLFANIDGLPDLASHLTELQRIQLAQQIGEGRFEFAYRDLPASLRPDALALEVAGRGDELALLDSAFDSQIDKNLITDLCSASGPQGIQQARSALINALVKQHTDALSEVLQSVQLMPGMAAADLDALTEQVLARGLSEQVVSPSGLLLPADAIRATAQALQDKADLNGTLTPALQAFVTGQLKAFDKRPGLAAQISAFGTPPPNNQVMLEQIRAMRVLGADEPVTPAHTRRAVLSALLTPLRQGLVGNCFATAVAIRRQIDRPEAMLQDLKTMVEKGWILQKTPQADRRLPINPGLSTGSDFYSPMSSDHLIPWTRNVAALILKDAGVPNPEERANELQSQALQMGGKEAQLQSPDDFIRHALASGMGFAVRLPPEGEPVGRQTQALLEELRQLTLPSAQFEAIKRAVAQGNADIHRLTQAEVPDEGQIHAAIDDVQSMIDLLGTRSSGEGQGLIQPGFDSGRFEQLANTARTHWMALSENRLLRTWEFSLGTMSSEVAQKPLDKELANDLLETTAQELMDKAEPSEKAAMLKLWPSLKTEVTRQFSRSLCFQFLPESVQELASDGHSSQGAWVLFDSKGSYNPSEWRRIDNEHEMRMTLQGLLRSATARAVMTQKQTQMKTSMGRIGQKLEAAFVGSEFDQKLRRTEPRQAIYRRDLVQSVCSRLQSLVHSLAAEVKKKGGSVDLTQRIFTRWSAAKEGFQTALEARIDFRQVHLSNGDVQWQAFDRQSEVPPAYSNVHTSQDLNAIVQEVIQSEIARISSDTTLSQGSDPITSLKEVNQWMLLTNFGEQPNPLLVRDVDDNSLTVDTPMWHLNAGGSSQAVLGGLGEPGRVTILMNVDPMRQPEDFFASLVTGLRANQLLDVSSDRSTAINKPLLAGTEQHAFSLDTREWADALRAQDDRSPQEWLKAKLADEGAELKVADMNWGTGSHPTYLVLRRQDGQIKVGISDGLSFKATTSAINFMRSFWRVWRDVDAG